MYVKTIKTVDLYQLPKELIDEVREYFHQNCPSNDSYVPYDIMECGFEYDYDAEPDSDGLAPIIKELHPKFNKMLKDEGVKDHEIVTVLISW